MSTNTITNPESPLDSQILKNLKQRVLKQAYEHQMNKKSERTTLSTNRQPSELDSLNSMKISRSVGDLTSSHRILTDSKYRPYYDPEIGTQPRSLQKREADRRKLMQEKDMLSSMERAEMLLVERQRIAREDYKRQLQQEIKRKQSLREVTKVQQKEFERSKLNREDSIKNKQSSFKEFYANANKFRDNAANGYLQYLSSSQQKQQRERQREKYDLQQNRNLIKVQMLEQFKVKRQKREHLKRALQQQMIEKQSMKVNELNDFKNRGYVKFETNNYNPIYNPIDYKMDVNNRYVLNEMIYRAQDYKLT